MRALRLSPNRRLVLALVFMLILVSWATSCYATTTLTLWHQFSGATEIPLKAIIDDFNKSQDLYKVESATANPLQDKLIVAVAGGAAPDIALWNRPWVPNAAINHTIIPLDSMIKRDKFSMDQFLPMTVTTSRYAGSTWVLPVDTDSRMLFLNQDLLGAAGVTEATVGTSWDTLWQAARRLTRFDAAGKLVQAGYLPFTWAGYSKPDILTYQNKGHLVSENGTQSLLATPEVNEALDWIVRFSDEILGGTGAYSGFRTANGGNSFINGRTAMQMHGSWLPKLNLAKTQISYTVMSHPVNKPGAPSSFGMGWGIAIPAGTHTTDAAWEFIKFFTSKEEQLKYAILAGNIPANREAAHSPALWNDNPVFRLFAEETLRCYDYRLSIVGVESFLQQATDKAVAHTATVVNALNEAHVAAQAKLNASLGIK